MPPPRVRFELPHVTTDVVVTTEGPSVVARFTGGGLEVVATIPPADAVRIARALGDAAVEAYGAQDGKETPTGNDLRAENARLRARLAVLADPTVDARNSPPDEEK